jgi:hypothetical protein
MLQGAETAGANAKTADNQETSGDSPVNPGETAIDGDIHTLEAKAKSEGVNIQYCREMALCNVDAAKFDEYMDGRREVPLNPFDENSQNGSDFDSLYRQALSRQIRLRTRPNPRL